MKKYSIGFIGYGNMARAITKSLLSGDKLKQLSKLYGIKISRIIISDKDENKLADTNRALVSASSNENLVRSSDIVVLAVKPQNAQEVTAGVDFTGKVVISIMAGISLESLYRMTGEVTEKIIRVMPNLNAKIGEAFSSFCLYRSDIELEKVARFVVSSFGKAQLLEEGKIDVATGIAGSGPAFVFKFIKAFYESGTANGLEDDVALEMALATISGSVDLIYAQSNCGQLDINNLISSVCSKGGTTIEGVNYLNENNFENTVSVAIQRAIKRAGELNQ